MSNIINSTEIIARLKDVYDYKTDKQLAEHLDIPTNTLANWKVRNSINWELIFVKCTGISMDYLMNGIGKPFIVDNVTSSYKEPDDKETYIQNSIKKSEELGFGKRDMLLRLLLDQSSTKKDKEEKISILFVDDEENNLHSFKATFRQKYRIHTAISGKEGLEILEEFPIDIIITDQRMPEMSGIEFLEKATEINPDAIRIIMSGYSEFTVVKEAINKGKVFYYLDKPWVENEIEEIIVLAYAVLVERKKSKMKTDELEELNQYLEFLLRQKLLS